MISRKDAKPPYETPAQKRRRPLTKSRKKRRRKRRSRKRKPIEQVAKSGYPKLTFSDMAILPNAQAV